MHIDDSKWDLLPLPDVTVVQVTDFYRRQYTDDFQQESAK